MSPTHTQDQQAGLFGRAVAKSIASLQSQVQDLQGLPSTRLSSGHPQVIEIIFGTIRTGGGLCILDIWVRACRAVSILIGTVFRVLAFSCRLYSVLVYIIRPVYFPFPQLIHCTTQNPAPPSPSHSSQPISPSIKLRVITDPRDHVHDLLIMAIKSLAIPPFPSGNVYVSLAPTSRAVLEMYCWIASS
jgi:hypothetical protein